ncbi:hypothetical protein [Mangrovihabitans endophyticus]|uniref:Uncharacterized protein n=1 Tax=Mangrovihabitans endophyticus TaxID=1751298 RepID=A0A8J3C4M0_9ACTN|nr:hypothetical protein [Mangrovihabitans endophyticus]GGL17914.1 hypothetical protein GCM10012284_60740 [Mangrovihabitans endophyticus]
MIDPDQITEALRLAQAAATLALTLLAARRRRGPAEPPRCPHCSAPRRTPQRRRPRRR